MLNSALRTSSFRAVSRQSFRFYSAAADGNPPVMTQIRDGLKAAMKAGNNVEKLVLRNIISEVKNRNINEPGAVSTDLKFVGMVRSLIATREKSIEEYQSANRNDLVEKEAAEIDILKKYAGLVPTASDADIDAKVQAIVDALPEADRKSINKIMGKIPWKEVETSWNSTRNSIASSVKRVVGVRSFSTSARASNHSNPLGLPRNNGAPRIPKHRPNMGVTRRFIPGVKHIVAVSSAKGGVGKSTVSANVALALFNKGLNVGILDVDIFGPSVPKLFNLSGEPLLNDDGKIVPLVNYGMKTMSMGYLVDPNKAVAWRGLLIQKALEQLLFDVEWGGIDVLVLDMPPGTGDVQLTIAQQVNVDGAVIVSTPQDMALIDAIRGIELYNVVKIPVFGMVQNMSLFVCPNCKHETHIFGTDGAIREAQRRNLDVLGSIPLSEDICLSADAGKPIVVSDPAGYAAQVYDEIAGKIMGKLRLKMPS